MSDFSALQRAAILSRLKSQSYDLLIIGGGITGAGIALDAASRGLRTALIEKNDFAFGTSSRSTKLIHGGLRYLKQLEFGLVKEVGSERAVVHNLAPHLVIPEKMLLPLSEKKGLGYWLTSIGLKIYDWLAGVRPEDQRRMLTRAQTLKYEPLLRKDDVKGGAIYAEYRTDDARLTIEIMKAAVDHKADALNYVRATDFVYAGSTIAGAVVADEVTGQRFEITATVVVNAAGPWVDELREINRSKEGKRLHLTKGVHMVVPHVKFPVKQAIYFDVDDGRMIFAIPRGRTTYVGTTDTNYNGDKDHVLATREDITYLLQAVNATFPSVSLNIGDVESSWAGLRPLIHEEGKSASELSRKDEIFESPSSLISIAGGKLTGYRKMAERVVNLVIRKYFEDIELKACYTNKIKLNGAFKSVREVQQYIGSLQSQGMSMLTARYLVENYGLQTGEILKLQDSDADADWRLLKAELLFCIRYEAVVSLSDFLVRRTGLLYFNIGKVKRYKEAIATRMKELLNWDEKKMSDELQSLDSMIETISVFK
ncbi:MAG TPA: glycerol-3-phosphate dehydrogenase/oxidase [Ohtaekwangia sp.]